MEASETAELTSIIPEGSGECIGSNSKEDDEEKDSGLTVELFQRSSDGKLRDTGNSNSIVTVEDEGRMRMPDTGEPNLLRHVDTPLTQITFLDRLKYASEQAKRFTPNWQKQLLHLSKDIVALLEKWDFVYQKALNSIIAPPQQIPPPSNLFKLTTSKHLLNLGTNYEDNNVDIATCLYLAGLFISWIEPEPKDILTTLQTIFKLLSKPADLCTTILQMNSKGMKEFEMLNPVLKELQHFAYESILREFQDGGQANSTAALFQNSSFNLQESSLTLVNNNDSDKPSTMTSAYGGHDHEPSDPSTTKNSSSNLNIVTFILTKDKNVSINYSEGKSQEFHIINSSKQELNTQEKLLLIKICLDEVFESLNTGFRDIVQLEINECYQEFIFRVENEIVPQFIEEGKNVRKFHGLTTRNCSHPLKIHLQLIYTKILEQIDKLASIEKNTRWILFALESLNQLRTKWAFPYEINHLQQIETIEAYGGMSSSPTENELSTRSSWPRPSKSVLKKIVPFLKKKKLLLGGGGNIYNKIVPFEQMFKYFEFDDEDEILENEQEQVAIKLSIPVDGNVGKLLFGNKIKTWHESTRLTRSHSENNLYTSTIFLSSSDVGVDENGTLTGRKKAKDKVLYLRKSPEPISRVHSSAMFDEEPSSSNALNRDVPLSWVKKVTDSERNLFWGRKINPNEHR